MGYDVYLDAVKHLLREDSVTEPLPNDAFVFRMHQGYQFLFFRVNEGPNPPVYYFGEGEYYEERAEGVGAVFPQTSASFSDFLLAEIDGHEQTLLDIERLRAERLQRGLAE